MDKPVGGRGHKAPYETTQVRVPVPIKPQVEKLIAQYRAVILNGGDTTENTNLDSSKSLELLACIKLVDRFVEEIGQTDSLHSPTKRNNRNLAKFRDWLVEQVKE